MGTKGTTNTEITEDFRLAQARKTLAASYAAVEDYGKPYSPEAWAGRLQVAVELLLDFVDEAAPGGKLDEIANAVGDLAANRAEMLEALTAVRDGIGVRVVELDRLTALERDVAEIRDVLAQAAHDIADERAAEQP